MKRLVPVTAAVAVMAALVATSALAKGASEAMITGPGLGGGISLAGEGQAGRRSARCSSPSTPASIPSVFATSPNPMQSRSAPRAISAPATRSRTRCPGRTASDELVQDLYPYANPTPVTLHASRASATSGSQRTVGGWYVASTTLKDELVAVGPAGEPAWRPVARRSPGRRIEVGCGGARRGRAALGAILLARTAVAGRAARDDLIRRGTISPRTPGWRARPGR